METIHQLFHQRDAGQSVNSLQYTIFRWSPADVSSLTEPYIPLPITVLAGGVRRSVELYANKVYIDNSMSLQETISVISR